jgi:outer membrane lipoprotein-sorting protein
MHLSLLVAVTILVPQEAKEAEALFKKMEEKLAKAKTVQMKSTASAKMEQGEMTLSADLFWEADNKVRLEYGMKAPEGELKSLYVSDAKSVVMTGHEKRSGVTPPKLTSDLVRSWSGGGGFFVTFWIEAATFKDESHPKRANVPKAVSFKMGAKEKIGDRDTQRIDFTLAEVESGEVSMSLWIDLATIIPVKREMRGFHGPEKLTLVETYSDFKLDEKIDPSKFELPKEAK